MAYSPRPSGSGSSISNGGGVVSIDGSGEITITAADGQKIAMAGGALRLLTDTEDPDTAISTAVLGFLFYVGAEGVEAEVLSLTPSGIEVTGDFAVSGNVTGVTKAHVGLGSVDNTSDASKPVSTAQQAALDAKADLVGGFVPSAQLPSYVDDVLEAANFAALPGTGATGKIYVTLDTNVTYRWSGSAYVEISASLAIGETSATAYRGDRGKTAYDHSQVTSGNPHGLTKNDIGLGNVENTALSTFLDSIGSTRGSLLYRGASSWAALTPGTSTYVLTSNGSGADPSWQAAGGGGGPWVVEEDGSIKYTEPSGTARYIKFGADGKLTLFNGTDWLSSIFPLFGNNFYFSGGIYCNNVSAFGADSYLGNGHNTYVTSESGHLNGNVEIIPSANGGKTYLRAAPVEFEALTSLGTPSSGNGRIGVIAGEVNVVDSSGNVSVISPHAKDAPDSLYRIAPGVDQMRRHANPYRGIVQYVAEDGREAWETFAERNARRPDLEPLVFADWDAVEAERVVTREAEIAAWHTKADAAAVTRAAWLAADPATRGPEPAFSDPQPQPYVAQARPEWARQVTREQLDAIVPVSVLAHQLRVQLIHEGIDPDSVTAAIAQIPDATAKKLASVEWEYAPSIRRSHALVASLAAVFSLTSEQVDDIFRKAAKL